ncbi:MULE transposase domain-containing protein [Phytophthora infestans]|uniref:MULE transposase domain-containing protein n=1 Tax=Phytophthora infestans TaxID=4787 RepID=A0A8S9TX75_PHYIN|nr:MULE transposase domain-containing protein [Phytophthora infestans]
MLPAYSDDWASVKGKAILEFLLSKNIESNRQTASRIKRQLTDVLQGNMEESYQKLESYLSVVATENPGSHYGFEKHSNGVFKRACFFPSSCLKALQTCRRIIGLDGTHLKKEMNKRGVFLLATAKDLNGHLIVFGLGLVDQEDGLNWRWFVQHMKEAIGGSGGEPWKPAFLSDRQKGLLSAVSELYPGCGHRVCVRHVITNVEKKTSSLAPGERALIFQMARSECEKDYDFYSSKLADTRPQAAEYLRKIMKEHWVTYAFSETYEQPTYDEVTSNLSESANQ